MSFNMRADIENINPSKITCKHKHETQRNELGKKRAPLAPRITNSKKEVLQNFKRVKLCKNQCQSEKEDNKDEASEIPCEIAAVAKPQMSEIIVRSNQQDCLFDNRLTTDDYLLEKEYIKVSNK